MKLNFRFGLNENEQPDAQEAYKGSKNFELSKSTSSMIPRLPIDLSDTATNAGDVRGIMQLVKRDDTETTLIQAGATVYLWDGATFTSKGTVNVASRLRGTYWSLDDELIITDLDKLTVVQNWDGTTLAAQTTGLGGNLFAKYGVVHNGRVWLLNITDVTTDLPHMMLASKFETPTVFDTSLRSGESAFATGLEAFYILTPDLRPINGVAVFHNILIVSTVGGQIFKLTGSSSADYALEPFYSGSAAIGSESMVNVGNDVHYMRKGGNIESLISTDTFGDVATDDLSRWIPDTVKDLTGAIAIYDQNRQKVFFFVANKVLVFFKDMVGTQYSPWSVYTTELSFAFNTQAALYMKRPGTNNYSVFFGDNVGNIYDMNGQAAGDAGTANILTKRTFRYLNAEEVGVNFRATVLTGRVSYRRVKAVNLNLTFDWGDEYSTPLCGIALKGSASGDTGNYYGDTNYYGGTNYYNEGFTFANRVSSRGFSPTGKGPGFFLTAEIDSTLKFQLDEIEIPQK